MNKTGSGSKNKVIYETHCVDSDSDEIEEIKIDTGTVDASGITRWQRLIGDYTINDVNDIIDELSSLICDNPDNKEFAEALKEAKAYQFSLSLKSRQRVCVKKDLNGDQFTTRVKIDYDRKELDEHYRVVNEARDRSSLEKTIKRQERPVQKNFGTKKYAPHLFTNIDVSKQTNDPSSWLRSL